VFFLDLHLVWRYRGALAAGVLTTVELAIVTLAVALLPALLVAVGRCFGPRWLAWPFAGLVSLIRAIPGIVSVTLIFFALPFAGVMLRPFPSLVLALATIHTAYLSEVFRGALAAVGRDQLEAAESLGLSRAAALLYVIVPQSIPVAAPAFVSSCIQLVHNTTIASVVTVGDLLAAALDVQTLTGNPSPLLAIAAFYWLGLGVALTLSRRLHRRIRPRSWDTTWDASPSTF
jgi:polar amino acid transport system permease protein